MGLYICGTDVILELGVSTGLWNFLRLEFGLLDVKKYMQLCCAITSFYVKFATNGTSHLTWSCIIPDLFLHFFFNMDFKLFLLELSNYSAVLLIDLRRVTLLSLTVLENINFLDQSSSILRSVSFSFLWVWFFSVWRVGKIKCSLIKGFPCCIYHLMVKFEFAMKFPRE